MANELKLDCVLSFSALQQIILMQTTKLFQAVILMLMVALVASCATTNEYVSRLFSPRPVKDTQGVAIKFLELDSLEADKQAWVKTDAEDSSVDAKTFPVATKTSPAVRELKTAIPPSIPDEPVAKTGNPDGTRSKKTRE